MIFYDKERLKKAAEKKIALGQKDKAIEIYQKILNREPNDKEILFMLGDLKITQGDRISGLILLKKAGSLYAADNEKQKAVTVFRKYLKYDEQNLEIRGILGDILMQLDQKTAAVEVFTRSGEIAMEADPGQAIFFFERVRKLDEGNLKALASLAQLYSRQDLVKKSLECHLAAGRKFYEKGDFESSYLHLYQYIQHEPEDRDVNLQIIDTLRKMRHFQEALIHLDSVFSPEQDNEPNLLTLRAELLLELGRQDELLGLVHKLVMLLPDGQAVLFRFVDGALEARQFDLAVKLLEHLDVTHYYSYGERLNQTLNQVLAEDEHHLPAMHKLVEYRVYVGDIPGAVSIYSRLVKLYMKNRQFAKARELLEQWHAIDEENEWVRRELQQVKIILEGESRDAADPFRGKLEEIGLADVIQMMESARKTGELQVRFGEETGRIFFQSGRIIHAVCGEFSGRNAIIGILRQNSGDFLFKPEIPADVTPSITGSNTQIVLEALRIIDEETGKIHE
jgi:tetratricopeptide (TPR) repeat protein